MTKALPYSLALACAAILLINPVPALGQDSIPAPPDVAAVPSDADVTDSGLGSRVLQAGTGTDKPGPDDWVTVHYTGWTTDGKMFDSSVARGQSIRLPLDAVIEGWTEGLQLMAVGEKRRLWIPEELAYAGAEGKPAGMLVFDVELLEVVSTAAPADVAAPPADAVVEKNGLATKVLQAGDGEITPRRSDVVVVHYTGWTTDGKMFDSSRTRGKPAMFPLNGVIKGWTQAMMQMTEGERRLIWIPEKLAYKGQKDKPQGTLVFDVELVRIQRQAVQ